ncbi:MAG: endopeptidase La, partial [Rickettsiales bacterium]|nr:endopeptidase La [Rickettsiales bacterium]
PDGTVKVLIEGQTKAKVTHITDGEEFISALVHEVETEVDDLNNNYKALVRSVIEEFDKFSKLNKKISPELALSISQLTDGIKLCDTIATHLNIEIKDKQDLLETINAEEKLEKILHFIQSEISLLQTENKIRKRVKSQMEKTQKDYYLNEQLKAIHKELDNSSDGVDEMRDLEEKIKKSKMTKEASKKALAELKKLKQMSPMSAEAGVIRNYIDWLISVPWNKNKRVNYDLARAEEILNRDHYGLEKVKERILEFLAVQQRTRKIKGPILCLVGPPGVGKTSLASSIAEATGRKYVRVSLGGVHDESEIRGHRRTYIGSMPGKIIQSMKKVHSSNPLFLLDEIDKMGTSVHGDPASALLEVLDPEQNNAFLDHFLDVDYDLSNVLFLATANSFNIPRPLLDRMEIIRLPGYTEDEKMAIAERHLIPKLIKEHGLKKGEWEVPSETIRDLIRYYTKEAGVRSLQRELATLARRSLKKILSDESITSMTIKPEDLIDLSGVRKYNFGEIFKEDQIGVVNGLAYTEVGGEMLTIEAITSIGKGKMTLTGQLGDVMQESIQAASSYVRSGCTDFGIIPPDLNNKDIHIHLPEGATPKDGPSAGVGMITAIVSVMTGIPVRRDIAMTGEITLRGRVLAIGGLKEKLLAALRGGIKKVLIPEENVKDLAEIPDNVKEGLEIIPVSVISEVLDQALVSKPEPVEWDEKAYLASLKEKSLSDGHESVIKH